MKVPNRVRIIKNNNNEYYNQFIGIECDITEQDEDEFLLPIPAMGVILDGSTWSIDELEIIEWEEM